jgi:hypothetical protein
VTYPSIYCALMPCVKVFTPAKMIFSGIGLLILVSFALDPSLSALVTPVFVRQRRTSIPAKMYLLTFLSASNASFRRLEFYMGVSPTTAMTDMIVEIMVEILAILAIVTKEVKQGRLS